MPDLATLSASRYGPSGLMSMLRMLLAPLGPRAATFHRRLTTRDRYARGLIIVLPGIDGCTTVSDNIARGLDAAGLNMAVELIDWRRSTRWSPRHLITESHHQQQAARISRRIKDYAEEFPDRPIHLIGHSAGAAMVLYVLRELHGILHVDSAVLLSPAISRGFDIQSLLNVTRRGIWNFCSFADLPALGIGTILFGTMDRRHALSAGLLGFRTGRFNVDPQTMALHQVRYSWRMAGHWHFGGHFGNTNAAFVRHYVAPLMCPSRGAVCFESSGKVNRILVRNER